MGYETVNEEEDIPEPVLFNVLGSCQKVLFLEGDAASLDRKIAAARYPGMQLRFLGGCEDVVRLVKALRKTPQIHRQLPVGLIDGDFRNVDECEALAKDFVFSHRMRDVENILVSEKVVEAALTNLAKGGEAEERIACLLETTKKRVEKKLDVVAKKLANRELRVQAFGCVDKVQRGVTNLDQIAWPDAKAIEMASAEKVKNIWTSNSWDAFLSLFSARKDDFRDIAARQIGFNNWIEAEDTLLGWLGATDTENGRRMWAAIAHYLPEMPLD